MLRPSDKSRKRRDRYEARMQGNPIDGHLSPQGIFPPGGGMDVGRMDGGGGGATGPVLRRQRV
jgi:hypothetical protein